jgi:hypothetical protein
VTHTSVGAIAATNVATTAAASLCATPTVQRERYVAADGDARTHTEAGGLVAISVKAGPVTVENLLHARLRDVHEQRRRERLRRVRDASHSQAT